MNWEKLTAPEFERAVKTSDGLCILSTGVIEKHGDHLPLGQDTIYIHETVSLAAERESAVVFPFFYFGQILEAKHVPGTIALRNELLVPLLENICDEIGRNGFTKIFIVNGHGGNSALLQYYCQIQLDRKKPYMVYLSDFFIADKAVVPLREASIDGHAGEQETTSMMYLHPELVHLEKFGDYGMPLERMKAYKDLGLATGFNWYADYPGHFAGEKTAMTREKGEAFINAHIDLLVRQMRLIKQDDTPRRLQKEFFERAQKPENHTR